ncbi:hypothetical protein C0992_011201 [Termitomyces sp. T32_za158]|nr:hypothetical protein C0992_011201 [Termitomyces sp. T32_za158]
MTERLQLTQLDGSGLNKFQSFEGLSFPLLRYEKCRILQEILVELAIAGDVTFSNTSRTKTTTGHKRPRDSDTATDAHSFLTPLEETGKAVVDPRHVSTEVPSGPAPPFVQPLNFDLPMYGNELGRLPVYGQFNFSESYKRPRRETSTAPPGTLDFPTSTVLQRGLNATLSSDNSVNVITGDDAQMTAYAETGWGTYDPPYSQIYPSAPLQQDQSGSLPSDGIPLMDSETLTMWSTAPTGFEYVIRSYETALSH